MESLLLRSGAWFGVALLALFAFAQTTETAFAVHMAMVGSAALLVMWIGLAKTDYLAVLNGLIKAPVDQSKYDDDLLRWGVILITFWG
mgnify:CR=1 FL=1